MKIFDRYFQPYAEYCTRTTFSEDELKAVISKECPATGDISWKAFKAAIGLGKTVVFSCNPDNPLHLTPLKYPRNSSAGDLFIQCEQAVNGETILHITIGPNGKQRFQIYGIFAFALLWGVVASLVIWWGILFSFMFIGFFFIVLEFCRADGMERASQVRQDFERMLREFENNNR